MGPNYVRGGIYLFIRAIQEYRASKMILYQKVLDDTKLIINGPFKIHNLEPSVVIELMHRQPLPQVIYNPITAMGFLAMFTF